VIVLSAKLYNPETALRQIHQVLELKKIWNPEWALDRSDVLKTVTTEEGKREESVAAKERFRVVVALHSSSAFTGSIEWSESRERHRRFEKLSFNLPRRNFWADTRLTDVVPNTLDEFAYWWDEVGRGIDVKVPFELCESGQVSKRSNGKRSIKHGTLDLYRIYYHNEINNLKPTIDLELIEAGGEDISYYGRDPSGDTEYDMPICTTKVVNVNQNALVRHFRNWEVGRFDDSFADLNRAARGLGSLELEDIQNLVAADAAKGTDVFEILGMKFPAGQITGWGVLGVLAVQLYFLVYLRQLAKRVGSTDAAWDVPWIGVDTSITGSYIFAFTAIYLPVEAIGLLSIHSIYTKPFYWNTSAALKITILTFAFACSCSLARSLWKCRRQLEEAAKLIAPVISSASKNGPVQE
jgi:hypothetical protein